MVHSSCRGRCMPTPPRIDHARKAIAAASLWLCMLPPAWATPSAMATASAGQDNSPGATAAAPLRISDLVMKEKKTRELELQRKLPLSASPAPIATPRATGQAGLAADTNRPVLWSLSGAAGNFLAEIVWQNRLLVVSSDQTNVPQLGTLEYMDETGIYIRPGRRHRLNRAWLDTDGLLVLPAPRDGQAAPVLVEIAPNASPPRPALQSAAHLPGAVPMKTSANQTAPWILASGEVTSVPVDLSPPKRTELLPPVSAPQTAPAMPLKGATAVQDKNK